MGRNRENFGALLRSIIGNLKSIIGPGLVVSLTLLFRIFGIIIDDCVYEGKAHCSMLTIAIFAKSRD